MDNLGYCCINQTLRKQNVYTGRSITRKKFSIERASELALKNCQDLFRIIEWNVKNNIQVFRIGSDIFPRITDNVHGYDFKDLSTWEECKNLISMAGKKSFDNKIILSCHPGPYTVLGSINDKVVENSIKEIKVHVLLGEMLRSNCPDLDFHINFHVGNKFSKESADRFCTNFDRLDDTTKSYIIIENDDKKSCWSVNKLYEFIYLKTGIPITFDYHHSQFSREESVSAKDEFELSKRTWGGKKQEVHYSSGLNNSPKHSDYILDKIPDWIINDNVYIHLEAKQKELAVIDYREKYLK